MQQRVMTAILIIAMMIAISAAYANPQAVPAAAPQQATAQDYCPTPDQLTKEGLFWNAPEGWVSYGESFDNRVTGFTKVEWIGINVGKVICIYKGDKRFGFPIALEQKRNKIVPSPSGYGWGKDRGGYKDCVSAHVKDCPFLFQVPKQDENPYEGLDFFKGKNDSNY